MSAGISPRRERGASEPAPRPAIWTIGHSTRSIEDFLSVLAAYEIEVLADVRRFPGSRRLPQFSEPAFSSALASHGMAYEWFQALGGRRRPDPSSVNAAWRHPAFRAYADHILTEEFAEGIFDLMMIALGARTAVMCAEVLWWRCHRRIIADVLTAIGFDVIHIRDAEHAELHSISAPGRLVRGMLRYD